MSAEKILFYFRPARLLCVSRQLSIRSTLWGGILFILLCGSNVNAELAIPLEGPVPEIDAIESTEPGIQTFEEETVPPPSIQPSFDDIPVLMSNPPEDTGQPESTGLPVFHNLSTGETRVGSFPALTEQESNQGGYYSGSDGGQGLEQVGPESFGTKTLINNVGSAPWRMNVKVKLRWGNSWGSCSGAMRDIRTVQLAGHCVFDNEGGRGWVDEVVVYPGWDGVGDPDPINRDLQTYGAARATNIVSWTGWVNNFDWNFDWAAVSLDRAVGSLTGWYGWWWASSCPSETLHVGSYPAENCPTLGLHNGRDMYYSFGTIDSCPGNQLQITTTPGCLTALWGGESGSNVYKIENGNRLTRGIASTSNRTTRGRYVDTKQQWVEFLNSDFIPNTGRGNTFDLHALDMNVGNATVRAGTATTGLNHLAANGTNGTKNATFSYTVRLSTNDNITTLDPSLSSQLYSRNFTPVNSTRVNMVNVTIPENTNPGNYYLGVIYASATDGTAANNDSSDWDAVRITVTQETNPPSPNPMTWATQPFELNTSQIRMVATTATDPVGPIQYFFDYTSSPTGGSGGNNSAWQTSRTYTDSNLAPNENYCYRVRARDGNFNANSYSFVSCDYTAARVPGTTAFSNVTQTSIRANWTANGNPAGTRYFVENTTAGTNSGWITSTGWNSAGLTCGTVYSFRVKARNGNFSETVWTNLGSQATLACSSACNGDFDGDGDVDGSDLGLFNTDFGRTDCGFFTPCNGDFDNDGDVDGSDLGLFNSDFGRTDCPTP